MFGIREERLLFYQNLDNEYEYSLVMMQHQVVTVLQAAN
jgi:hypothetical protein